MYVPIMSHLVFGLAGLARPSQVDSTRAVETAGSAGEGRIRARARKVDLKFLKALNSRGLVPAGTEQPIDRGGPLTALKVNISHNTA